ncbi:MAG: hypothetical protein ACK41C_10250 [Phenylobacterium sp.]|jgi:hypothetical protein|uniref:hypothetical protein n=1 Tax=Phenylobacterium sp. TaxID=1871053 RepID=UPI0039197E50
MSPKAIRTALAAFAASAALAVPGAFAHAQSVDELAVSGRAPTELSIPLAGKSADLVRDEVRAAARTVCRNAVANRELEVEFRGWCSRKSAARAMDRYALILARASFAEGPTSLTLSAR